MQTLTIDLKKNPAVADFLVDKEPGDAVCLHSTIKSLDDQTCVVTLEEVGEGMDDEKEEKDEEEKGDMVTPPAAEEMGRPMMGGEGSET